MSSALSNETPGRGAGWNELRGYSTMPVKKDKATLNQLEGSEPSIPSIDPDNLRRIKFRPAPVYGTPVSCGFEVDPQEYKQEFTRSHQKGYKATKVGVHATITEKCQTELLKKKDAKDTIVQSVPSDEIINEEYNRYKYGDQLYPGNYGKDLQGARPVLLMGNQIVYTPALAMGDGDAGGGRRSGHQADKYSIVDRY